MIRLPLALTLLALAAPASAQTASPEQLPAAFIAAWNAHDPAAFEKLYTPDATWVPVAEERTEGRVAIIGEFAKIHTGNGWAIHTVIAAKGETVVHRVNPDVATIFFHMDFMRDGQPVAGLQRALILVAVADHGQWRIAAGQLTKESPAS